MSGQAWFVLFFASLVNLFVVPNILGIPGFVLGQSVIFLIAFYIKYLRGR